MSRHVQQQLARSKADSSTTIVVMEPLVVQLGPRALARQAVAAVADLLAPAAPAAAALAYVVGFSQVLHAARGLPAAAAQVGTLRHPPHSLRKHCLQVALAERQYMVCMQNTCLQIPRESSSSNKVC
jgi:hypothetical protein